MFSTMPVSVADLEIAEKILGIFLSIDRVHEWCTAAGISILEADLALGRIRSDIACHAAKTK